LLVARLAGTGFSLVKKQVSVQDSLYTHEVAAMAFRRDALRSISAAPSAAVLAAVLVCGLSGIARAQVFVVGEKTAMADVSTEFHPTRVELPSAPITERGRLELVRNLEAEQGFAHRPLPLGDEITLMANGNLTPGGDAYKELLYKKGESAQAGDRVALTKVTVKADRIVFDINGGPYLDHRWMRHIEINDTPLVPYDGKQVTGFRLTLVFEGGIPDISAPEVKALLDPLIDFGVKTGSEAYADTLPAFLKSAIAQHDILVGMDRKMVIAAAGAPESKVRELLPGSTDKHYEEWIYGQAPQTVRFVRFVGDRVTQVKIAALGQPIAIHDKNEMEGYLDPEDTNEVALGDGKPGAGAEDGPAKAPPSILKPGEVAPGSTRRVLLPVTPPAGSDRTAQDKSDPASANPPAAPADKPADPPTASNP
jgi:hypothetical protein